MAKQTHPKSQDNLLLKPQTLEFLGLEQQPFTTSILSEEAIYSDPVLAKLFGTLKHHLEFSELILIVEGPLGSGKTTLFRRMFQIQSPSLFLLPIQAEATDTLVQIQQKMSIHLQDQGDANYLDDNLKRLSVFDQMPALIIDDAHLLSDTTLQELLRYKQQLADDKDVQLKLLLLANPGMANTLEQISNLDHSQLYVQSMPAFTPKQIQAFINHRLKQAGVTEHVPLDDKQLDMIVKKTAGTPSAIMAQATTVLDVIARNKSNRPNLQLTRPICLLIILTLVTLVGLASYFFLFTETPQQPQITPALTEPSPAPTLQAPAPVEHVEEFTTAEGDIQIHDQPQDIATITGTLADNSATEDLITDTTPPVADNDKLNASENMPEEMIASPVADVVTEPVIPEAINMAPAPIEPPVAAEPIAEPAQPLRPSIKAPSPKPAEKAPVPTPAATTLSPALQQLEAMGLKNPAWLKQQSPDRWTLQVLGARDPETLIKFARQHRLGADSAWFITDLNGKPWYVLVHRLYGNRDIARNAISRLPAGLRQARPWVKSLQSIHKSMH